MTNGQTVIISGAEPFNEAVKKNIGSQYQGVTNAPISQGQLKLDISTLADTEAAQALLRGDYEYPEDCDEATECIFCELAPLFAGQRRPIDICLETSEFN